MQHHGCMAEWLDGECNDFGEEATFHRDLSTEN